MVNTYLTTKNKTKTLTEKQQKFLDCLIATNGDPKQAAELAGYSGNHYQVISSLKEEIIDLATNVLANSAPEAAFKLVEIMKTNKPKTRYVITRKIFKNYYIPGFLPDRWVDRLIGKMLGLIKK